MIKFHKIHIKNFLSIEDSTVVLDKGGYIRVTGVNENPDDNAASNGAGKSSIFESVAWTLTGDTIRGTKDVKRFGSESACEVTLDFSVNDVEYSVTRTKDPSNLFIYVNGENKSGKGIRDSEKLLQEYLPDLTAQLIGSVIIMGQGLPMRFSNNTPSGRKDVLEKLSKSDFMIEDIKERVSARKSTLTGLKRELEDVILKNNTVISTKESEVIKCESEYKTLSATTYDDRLEDKTRALRLLTESIDDVSNEIKTTTSQVNFKKDELLALTKKRSEEKDSVSAKFSNLIMSKREEISDSTAKERELNSQINKIKNIKTHCPTCGQPLAGVTKPDPTPLIEQMSTQHTLTESLTADLNILTQEQSNEWAKISSKYTSAESSLNTDISTLQQTMLALNTRYTTKERESKTIQSEINALELQKKNHEYKLEQLKTSITECKSTIQDAKTLVEQKNVELEHVKAHLDMISKFENALKRDFRGILLGNIIKYIDMKAKEYSKIVFETDKLDFKLDGNNISISYCGKEYENLSGGEKQRTDLIVQFALRDMLCKYLNFSSNILVLDEIVDNLDEIGCQKVMQLISSKLTDVDSIYIISHHADIPMPADHELVIIKNSEGISNVRNDSLFGV